MSALYTDEFGKPVFNDDAYLALTSDEKFEWISGSGGWISEESWERAENGDNWSGVSQDILENASPSDIFKDYGLTNLEDEGQVAKLVDAMRRMGF